MIKHTKYKNSPYFKGTLLWDRLPGEVKKTLTSRNMLIHAAVIITVRINL